MKNQIVWIVGIIVILLIAFFGYNYVLGESSTIDVQGNSEISVEPDEAKVWAGVSFVRDSADKAQDEINIVISTMIEGLVDAGIAMEDIETERLNLYEEFAWKEGGRESEGWRASQTLKIKTEDMNKVGEIVDIAVSNGANQINNIEFTLSEKREQEFKQQVVAQATTNAKEKAETIANSLDVRLVKIKSASEAEFGYRPYIYGLEAVAGDAAVKESATVTPEDVTVSANIGLVYVVR